jgi:phosphate transport system substrate-binding protein
MSKTQSPVPAEPRPLLTIHIHKKTGVALLVGIAVLAVLAALALHRRNENPSAVNAQTYDGQKPFADGPALQHQDDAGSQSNPRASTTSDSSESTLAPPLNADADYGAEPMPYHPGNTDDGDTKPAADPGGQGPVLEVVPVQTDPPQADSGKEEPTQPEANDRDDQPSPTPTPAPDSTPSPDRTRATLNGAGATSPNPIYQKWFSEFHRLHPDVQINYQSIGSGGGITQLQRRTVDFGASDGPMSDEQLSRTPFKVFHIPTVLGAVVLTYNIPGVNQVLNFTPDVIADIYLGKINDWSDPRLARANPGVKLPYSEIVVVHRSDPSGTTYIFTDYLSKVSPDWANGPQKGTAINWPVGLSGKGNEGVSGTVKQTPGSIGYVELIYALANNMSYGTVQNAAGRFVKASLESTTAAAASIQDMPDDFRVSITNAPGANAYPIASFTWLLVPQHFADPRKGRDMFEFLHWMIDDGERSASVLGYAPLPKNVAAKVKVAIAQAR